MIVSRHLLSLGVFVVGACLCRAAAAVEPAATARRPFGPKPAVIPGTIEADRKSVV